MWRPFLAILAGILVGLWEAVALSFLPSWLAIYPIIPMGVFLVLTSGRQRVLLFMLSAGLVVDGYALWSGSFSLLRLPIVFFLIGIFATRWITNRSLLGAMGLVLLARAMDVLSAWLFGYGLFAIGLYPMPVLWSHSWLAMIVWDLLQMAVWFGIGLLFTRRFWLTASSSSQPPYVTPLF